MAARKKSLSTRIAEEFINEIMMAGIAFLLVVAGINYFNMKWAWLSVMMDAAGASHSSASAEVTRMLSALTATFPFKYLFGQFDFWSALIIAVCLTLLGLGLKALTVRTKGKFIIDIGKNIEAPAVIGFMVIIALQIWNAFKVEDYLARYTFLSPEIPAGYFIWNTYGQLFLIGAALLVIGAIIKLVGEKNKARKMLLVGNAMFSGSFILIIYYFIIRILAVDVVLNSSFGKVMTLFLISSQYSSFTVMVCVFLFTFGRELRRYGRVTLRIERRLYQVEQMKKQYDLVGEGIEKKLVPKKLSVSESHLRKGHAPYSHPAFSTPGHPVHRYVEPKGRYRHKQHK